MARKNVEPTHDINAFREIRDARFTLQICRESVWLEVEDFDSRETFVRVELTPQQFVDAMARLACVPCKATVGGLGHIGKYHECKDFDFVIPEKVADDWKNRQRIAAEIAARECPDGWTAEEYFGSQDSFFSKDGKNYARCTIRRWVDAPTPIRKEPKH